MDNLVVLIAPSPDDEEGLVFMNKLLSPDDLTLRHSQPIVVLNYHMIPVDSLPNAFEVAYHLRMLSVSFMASGDASQTEAISRLTQLPNNNSTTFSKKQIIETNCTTISENRQSSETIESESDTADHLDDDAELKAAMAHAADLAQNKDHGTHKGTTRAMVIRAYPRPWHIFVDLAPDEDVDFEVAATFDEEPSVEDVHASIVECIEGSEIEEELVAQQMQAALEAGQLENANKWLDIESQKDEDEDDNNEENEDIEAIDDKQE